MQRFEIRLYEDGGPNDRGICIGYVEANDPKDAKIKFAKGKKNAKDIINTGFYEARKISDKDYNERKSIALSNLRMYS